MGFCLRTVLATFVGYLLSSCTTTEVTLPALDVSQAMTTDAIVVKVDATMQFKMPNGLVRGSGDGATKAMGEYLSDPPSGDEGVVWLLTLPVALPISAAVGAGLSHSTEEVDSALAAYRGISQDRTIRNLLGGKFMSAIEDDVGENWVCIEEASESEPKTCATHKSIAELRLYPEFKLEIVGEYDPDIHFFGTVLGFVSADRSNPSSFVSAKWAYRDKLGDFFDLTANDAALLRSELKAIFDRFAIAIVEDLFLEPQQVTVVRRDSFALPREVTDIPQSIIVRVGWSDVISECQKYGWLPPAQCL